MILRKPESERILSPFYTPPLTANNSSGDPITLGLTPLPLPDNMEYNIATGEFSFQPVAGQVDDYTLTFSALTGDERVTETINID